MFQPVELARFAISEFERNLEGLTDDEARVRAKKADGTEMNSISWTIGHIAAHWIGVSAYASGEDSQRRFLGPDANPTPLSLSEALEMVGEARTACDWLGGANDKLLSTTREEHIASLGGQESIGTALVRVTLHTWFHLGEINAMRQMLGHGEIPFVGQLIGNLEWRSS